MQAFSLWLRRWQWRRGVRALLAIGSVMAVCHGLGRAPQAAALGAFNALLVDNGGPYRPRLTTMMVAVVGGALSLVLGCLLPATLWVVVPATLAVCFAMTYARVLSQPVTSSSVLILVTYFAGLGGSQHTPAGALTAAAMVLGGGAWAMVLSLLLWPVDPFRPARIAVAECFRSLAEFTHALTQGPHEEAAVYDWQRHQRVRLEEARAALSATVARAPSRTLRVRALTILLETGDLLLARTMRLTELAGMDLEAGRLHAFARWLAAVELAVAKALEHRPADEAESFAPAGSHTLELLQVREWVAATALEQHVRAEEREALSEMRAVFDAVRALWTGVEHTRARPETVSEEEGWSWLWIDSHWRDALQGSWTLRSVNMRHALRLMLVGAVDVLAMRAVKINHGFWLPMTSIILMQPYSAGTNRKSVQRVTGTIAGGLLAAVLAAAIPGQGVVMMAITALAGCTLATFAVDYAVYCFFLTPTFVLMSLPHLHDWRYAGTRMATTLAGAAIAITAMRTLWPERAEAELGQLLRRGVQAEAAYLRAVAAFVGVDAAGRKQAEREVLAPARRACGLASNDAEEAVDRVMQEPHFIGHRQDGRLAEQALTVTTYLRRLTQSLTTLAPTAAPSTSLTSRLERLAARLEGTPGAAEVTTARPVLAEASEERLQRIERQAGVLQRALAGLGGTDGQVATERR